MRLWKNKILFDLKSFIPEKIYSFLHSSHDNQPLPASSGSQYGSSALGNTNRWQILHNNKNPNGIDIILNQQPVLCGRTGSHRPPSVFKSQSSIQQEGVARYLDGDSARTEKSLTSPRWLAPRRLERLQLTNRGNAEQREINEMKI